MASSFSQGFENVQNLLGSIVLDEEEGIKCSSGDLEGKNHIANIMDNVLMTCQKFVSSIDAEKSDIARIIITYQSCSYIVNYENKKRLIYIVKTGSID